MRLRWLLLTLLLFAACAERAQSPWGSAPELDVDLRMQVEPVEVGLMQPVTITLDRYRKNGVDVQFDPQLDAATWLETARVVGDEQPLFDGLWQRTTLTVLPIDGPKDLTLAEFVATVVGDEETKATTPEQIVTVLTALDDHDKAKIEAPGDPLEAPIAPWMWFGIIFGGALVLLLLVAWFGREKKVCVAPRLIELPHVKALRELQRWRGASRATDAEVEAFYVGTSHVLRVYLEERFGLHAPERTTEEFLRELEGGDQLARSHRQDLERFLSQCDLVKFAKHQPAASEHDVIYQLAEAFVESTRGDRGNVEAAS